MAFRYFNFVETKDRLEAVVSRSIIPLTVFEGELLSAGHACGAECSAALRTTSRSTREVSMPTWGSAGHRPHVGDPLRFQCASCGYARGRRHCLAGEHLDRNTFTHPRERSQARCELRDVAAVRDDRG